jgi:hypothetical protein
VLTLSDRSRWRSDVEGLARLERWLPYEMVEIVPDFGAFKTINNLDRKESIKVLKA